MICSISLLRFDMLMLMVNLSCTSNSQIPRWFSEHFLCFELMLLVYFDFLNILYLSLKESEKIYCSRTIPRAVKLSFNTFVLCLYTLLQVTKPESCANTWHTCNCYTDKSDASNRINLDQCST